MMDKKQQFLAIANEMIQKNNEFIIISSGKNFEHVIEFMDKLQPKQKNKIELVGIFCQA